MNEPRKLKRAVIKEEMVALTGDAVDALLLNHFIKCQARARHVERYIEEERARFEAHGDRLNLPATEGWFYKKSEELSEETMLGLSKSNMRARITKLVERGWVEERDNPVIRWDKTKQYRVNIRRIDSELRALGYYLDGWLIEQIAPSKPRSSKTKLRNSDSEIGDFDPKSGSSEPAHRSSVAEHGDSDDDDSEFQDATAIPSSTTSRTAGNNNKQQEATAVVAELIKEMTAFGVTVDVAIDLASNDPEECRRQLDYLPYREGRTNKGGTLVKAVREKWAAPDGWAAAQEGARRDSAARAEAARHEEERRHEADQRRRADQANQVLDQMYAALDARTRDRIDEEARDRLGVLGRLGQNEAALQAMRRTLLRERLGQMSQEGE